MISEDRNERIDRALRHAIAGEAVIFIGSGVSFLTDNEVGKIPSVPSLIDLLLNDIELKTGKKVTRPNAPSLSRLGGYYKKQIGPNQLKNLLTNSLKCIGVDPKYERLLEIPWQRIYTTNFDDAIDFALPNRQVLSFTDAPKSISNGAIVHLNGYINDLKSDDLDDDIVLTDWSYIARNLAETPWNSVFQKDIESARAVFFLGFSMEADLDISRSLASISEVKNKTIFFVGPDTDEIDSAALEDFGQVETAGFTLLAARHKQVKKSFDVDLYKRKFKSFSEIKLATPDSQSTSLSDLQNQFIFGSMKPEDLFSVDDAKYSQRFFTRDAANKIAEEFSKGLSKNALIVGGPSTGKTIATAQICRALLKQSFRVFWASSRHRLLQEVDSLAQIDGDCVVVFDNYVDNFDILEHLVALKKDNIRILLTSNAALHDAFSIQYDKLVLDAQVNNLDVLNRSEVIDLNRLLNKASLWFENAGQSETHRNRIISENYKSSLTLVLLDIVKSEHVQTTLQNMVAPILDDGDAKAFFTGLLIDTALSLNLEQYDWFGIYSEDKVTSSLKKYSNEFEHFFSSATHSFLSPSRIAGEFVLRRLLDNISITDAAIDIYLYAKNVESDYRTARNIMVELMKYSRVEPMFRVDGPDPSSDIQIDGSPLSEVFSDYYDELKRLGGTENNHEYWLQYGIALAIHSDLRDKTELHKVESIFASGKSKTKGDPKKSRNLDNFYARFQLLKAAAISDPQEAFKLMVRSTSLLFKKIMVDGEDKYPFRVGRSFVDIAAAHFSKWDDSQKSTFIQMSERMKSDGEDYLRRNGYERSVDYMVTEITQMLKSNQLTG